MSEFLSAWLSVKDQLPEDDVGILVTNGESIEKTYYCKHSHSFGMEKWFGEVTHWMYLPEVPNKVEK